MATPGARLRHAWNVLVQPTNKTAYAPGSYGPPSTAPPSRRRLRMYSERTIVSSIYNRLAIDIASADIRHCRLDDNEQYLETISSGLNNCLTLSPNIDQRAGGLKRDIAMTMFTEGVAAIVPVITTLDPNVTGAYDVQNMRVGRVVNWYPQHVTIELYNDQTGIRQNVTLSKDVVALVENPFYSVMNEPNSTLQRLIRKLALLDQVDDASSSGKLDLIIQLPYVIKSDARRTQAEQRRKDIEFQLKQSTYGIAYTDGTEKITQLNRSADNTLMEQITYLTQLLYTELGVTPEILNSTATPDQINAYFARTIEPFLDEIVQAMMVSFLTQTARTQSQAVKYFRNPFKYIPIEELANVADTFSRNEILTANEFRSAIGFKPSSDPSADKLQNSNMPDPSAQNGSPPPPTDPTADPTAAPSDGSTPDTSAYDSIVNDVLDQLGSKVSSILGGGDNSGGS